MCNVHRSVLIYNYDAWPSASRFSSNMMLKVHLCLGMVALVLRFSDATHPGVAGQLYEHTTASPTAAPTTTTAGATEEPVMEPKILLENGSLVLQSTDIKLRLAGQAAPFTVGHCGHPPSTCGLCFGVRWCVVVCSDGVWRSGEGGGGRYASVPTPLLDV